MKPTVLFLHGEEILYLIILSIDPSCNLIGHAQEFGPVKAVIAEKKPQGHALKDQECEECSVPADEEKYISHRK
jgi:hypothetical protein